MTLDLFTKYRVFTTTFVVPYAFHLFSMLFYRFASCEYVVCVYRHTFFLLRYRCMYGIITFITIVKLSLEPDSCFSHRHIVVDLNIWVATEKRQIL